MVRAGLAALMLRLGLAVLLLPGAAAAEPLMFEDIVISAEASQPSIAVELIADPGLRAAPELETLRPDVSFIVSRMRSRPVAFSGVGLHPAAREAYSTWRRAGPRLDILYAERGVLVQGLGELLAAYQYEQVPDDQLRVPPGLPLVLERRLGELASEAPLALGLVDVPAGVAAASTAHGFVALRDYLTGEWLSPLEVEIDVLEIQREAAMRILVVALEGSKEPLTATQLLLLSDLHFDVAKRRWAEQRLGAVPGVHPLVELGPVVRTCEAFIERFGPEHPMAPEILYLLAWALLEPDSDVRDDDRGMEVLHTLLESSRGRHLAPQVRFLLAEALFSQYRTEEALELYRKSVDDQGEHSGPARYKLAWCHYRLNHPEQALSTFADLARSPPTPSVRDESLHYMAVSLTDLALAEGRSAVEVLADRAEDELTPGLWAQTGEVALGMGLYDQAVEVLRHTVQRWPDDPDAPTRLAQVARILAADPLAEPGAAQAAYADVIEQFGPGTPWWAATDEAAHDRAMGVLEEAERHLALDAYERASASGVGWEEAAERLDGLQASYAPDDPTIGLYLASSLAGAGELDRAMEQISLAAEPPAELRCSAWRLALTLAASVGPDERAPDAEVEDVSRRFSDGCVADLTAAHTAVSLADKLAGSGLASPSAQLLRAGWERFPEGEGIEQAARPVVPRLAELDALAAASICVDLHHHTRRWKECRRARKEVGRRMLTGWKD